MIDEKEKCPNNRPPPHTHTHATIASALALELSRSPRHWKFTQVHCITRPAHDIHLEKTLIYMTYQYVFWLRFITVICECTLLLSFLVHSPFSRHPLNVDLNVERALIQLTLSRFQNVIRVFIDYLIQQFHFLLLIMIFGKRICYLKSGLSTTKNTNMGIIK